MHGIDEVPVHPDVFTLAKLLRPEWDCMNSAIRHSGVPVMLEDDGGDGDDGGGDDGSGAGGATGPAGSTGAAGATGAADDDDEVEYVRIPKAEYDENLKKARQQSARAKAAEKSAKEQREKEAAEQGRYQELAEGYKTERDEALKDRDAATADYTNLTRRIEVEKIAKRLDFIDTEDAWIHIQRADLPDTAWGNPADIERGLKKILREKSHLQGKSRPTGASRKGGGATLTHEEISRMSETEINTRWDEVQAALASQ